MTPITAADLEAQLRAALDAGDTPTADRLAAEIDAATRVPEMVPNLLGAALYYIEQGLPVFPLSPGSKIPFKGTGGCKDATTDADMVRSWWEGNPRANIGIATGHLVDVVDIDGPEGQRSRVAHWEDIFAQIDADSVAKVLTPRHGGMHIMVPPTGDGNAAGIVPGVDYRGKGGYVLAPPSVLIEGLCKPTDTPGSYRFLGTPHFARLGQGRVA